MTLAIHGIRSAFLCYTLFFSPTFLHFGAGKALSQDCRKLPCSHAHWPLLRLLKGKIYKSHSSWKNPILIQIYTYMEETVENIAQRSVCWFFIAAFSMIQPIHIYKSLFYHLCLYSTCALWNKRDLMLNTIHRVPDSKHLMTVSQDCNFVHVLIVLSSFTCWAHG